MTYSEKLKDPRWQRKRLEIMQRDDFTCRNCRAKDKTLHVHHVRYLRGRDPWEYKEFYLVTLCEDCHENEERTIKASGSKIQVATRSTMTVERMSFEELLAAAPEIEPAEESKLATEEEMDAFFKQMRESIESIK